MNVDLSPENAAYLQQQVALGHFASEQEALNAAITALQKRQQQIEEVRAMLQPALDGLRRGERYPVDAEEIKREGRAKLAQQVTQADAKHA